MSDARDRLDNWLNKEMPVYEQVPDYWQTDARALIAEHAALEAGIRSLLRAPLRPRFVIDGTLTCVVPDADLRALVGDETPGERTP